MKKGDWFLYYSPKPSLASKEPLQAFTALGQITDDDIYQVAESETFKPFRRRVNYETVRETKVDNVYLQLMSRKALVDCASSTALRGMIF